MIPTGGICAGALATCVAAPVAAAVQGPEALLEGHWLVVRGELDKSGVFLASRIEVEPPQEEEVLIGTIRTDGSNPSIFRLIDQPVHVSDRTEWSKLEPRELDGVRVKVEGHWRGPLKFSARKVSSRGPGRDRIAGRIDAIRRVSGGYEARVMSFAVFVPANLELEHEVPLNEIGLAPLRVRQAQLLDEANEDDVFGRGILLADNLRMLGQLELRYRDEEDFNLGDIGGDRDDISASARIRFEWAPSRRFQAVAEVRHAQLWRDDEEDGKQTTGVTRLGETYGYFQDVFHPAFDLQVGRIDFDERREWIYDQNLDAVRAIVTRPGLRSETSVSTTLGDGSDRDQESLNLIQYLSNGQRQRHLAAWAVYRDIELAEDEKLLFGGVRALGEWLPANRSWLELALTYGERGDTDILGWGYDIGTTWTPSALDPLAFTLGYALGTGDSNPSGSEDGTFRQTGFHDNNAKFAGVTSFRYYGELLDPELANLGILTAGIGARVATRTSLDLVFHHYLQDQPLDRLYGADLDRRPTGLDADIGWELDLIFGFRRWRSWDIELVGSWFRPGSAFTEDNDAFLGRFQLRYRF